jgi:hypothetical protein
MASLKEGLNQIQNDVIDAVDFFSRNPPMTDDDFQECKKIMAEIDTRLSAIKKALKSMEE